MGSKKKRHKTKLAIREKRKLHATADSATELGTLLTNGTQQAVGGIADNIMECHCDKCGFEWLSTVEELDSISKKAGSLLCGHSLNHIHALTGPAFKA